MGPPELARPQTRAWVAFAFTAIEDVAYVGLGLLLTGSALALLVTGVIDFGRRVATGEPHYVELLDRILLILLIVELLYTVQVSLRTHALVVEPFLLVGLISAIRRVLVLTAKFGESPDNTPGGAQAFVMELAVLTALIVALVGSLILLRKSGVSVVAPVAGTNACRSTRFLIRSDDDKGSPTWLPPFPQKLLPWPGRAWPTTCCCTGPGSPAWHS